MSSQKPEIPELFNIDDTLIEAEILTESFLCNLNACKGACCVKGASGAPLEEEEKAMMRKIYPKVMPYMRKEGIQSVEKHGTYVEKLVGRKSKRALPTTEAETPLVNGKECAYVTFDRQGIAKCAIEQAYEKGDIDFKKPVSCHLYPIRVEKESFFYRLRYDRWKICNPACLHGAKHGVKIFEFLKEALIRRFGQQWYDTLLAVYASYIEGKGNSPDNARIKASEPGNSAFRE